MSSFRVWLDRVHLAFAMLLIVAGGLVLAVERSPDGFNAGVKAALMAMVAAGLVLAGFYPSSFPKLSTGVSVLGTLAAIATAWFWLEDATEGDAETMVIVVFSVAGSLVIAVSLTLLLVGVVGNRRSSDSTGTDEDQPPDESQE